MNLDDITKLSARFPDEKLSVKAQSISKNRDKALLIVYLQHTDVADRLDSVDPSWSFDLKSISKVEVMGFKGELKPIFQCDGSLVVKGVKRANVGEGDDPKSAASDCFKRCAMLFGVGRYLYDQGQNWAPYDETRDKYKNWTMKDIRALQR